MSAPPDTSNMTHEERLKALQQWRYEQEKASTPVEGGEVAPGTQAEKARTLNTMQGGGISERPSTRIHAPPGGKSNISFG